MRMVPHPRKTEVKDMDTGADLLGTEDRPGNGRANGTGAPRARNRGQAVDGPSHGMGAELVPGADTVGRVSVADSQAVSAPKWIGAPLKMRLLWTQSDVNTLTKDAEIKGKTRDGGQYSYKGISGAQVVAVSKAALIDNGVLFTAEIDVDSVKIEGNKTRLLVIGTFECADTDEKKVVRMWGEGTDNADNGTAKAFTGGTKQILLKQLNLTTVEDEKTTEVEHETQPRGQAVREAEALTQEAVQTWGDAFRAALRGATSLNELKRIRAENASMMKKVPEATQSYFAEMIAQLEGTLS